MSAAMAEPCAPVNTTSSTSPGPNSGNHNQGWFEWITPLGHTYTVKPEPYDESTGPLDDEPPEDEPPE